MNQLKFLVFSAAFGNGHKRAAEAVIEEIQRRNPGAAVTHLDFGDVLSKRFNAMAKKLYIELIKHSPKLWGKFYYQTSKLSPNSRIQGFLNQLGRSDFLKYIKELNPDLIVCTYPTVASILGELRLERILQVPLVTIVTDYTVHNHWLHSGVDLYLAACEEVKDMLVKGGILPGRICVTGIPVSPKFEKKPERRAILAQLGIRPDLPTFLVLGASGSFATTKNICRQLAYSQAAVQSLIVCGNDENLYNAIAGIVREAPNPMLRFGYVDNMEELMSASDLIITKAGGLTVTEALTKHLPLLIYKPIPGQEEENAYFLERVGAGRLARTDQELGERLDYLLSCAEELEKMRARASTALPGHSAHQAVNAMLEILKNHQGEQRTG